MNALSIEGIIIAIGISCLCGIAYLLTKGPKGRAFRNKYIGPFFWIALTAFIILNLMLMN